MFGSIYFTSNYICKSIAKETKEPKEIIIINYNALIKVGGIDNDKRWLVQTSRSPRTGVLKVFYHYHYYALLLLWSLLEWRSKGTLGHSCRKKMFFHISILLSYHFSPLIYIANILDKSVLFKDWVSAMHLSPASGLYSQDVFLNSLIIYPKALTIIGRLMILAPLLLWNFFRLSFLP